VQLEANVASASFDAVADNYDVNFTESIIGTAQRKAVWRKLRQTYTSGDHLLEIGCGTGEDACFLAQRGVGVLACDASSRMVSVARQKVINRGLERLVKTVHIPAEEIQSLSEFGMFDGAYSNFGSFNCIDNLEAIAQKLARLVRPHGNVLICMMSRYCLWEIAWFLLHGNTTKAFRRLHSEGITTCIGGLPLRVRYPSVRQVARAFAPGFQFVGLQGIGIFVPPSYVESLARRSPFLIGGAATADAYLAACPGVRTLADHILLHFKRIA